jgi:adenylylsulfate reductase subunit A
VYGTVRENQEGRGPCYLKTEGITALQEEELKKAYLNMAPSQTLKWIESGKNPGEQNVEIEGTEPYIVGGHTASGYWVDTKRKTTIDGLFAAGDVAGGCPQKYVTGALVEGEIAAKAAIEELEQEKSDLIVNQTEVKQIIETKQEEQMIKEKKEEVETYLNKSDCTFSPEQLEEAMQKVMDTYAGGIGCNYQFNEKQLALADEKIEQIMLLSNDLSASDMHEVMFIYELKERLTVCKSVIAHLRVRKETRWHSFAENLDYPEKSDEWLKYVNSKLVEGKLEIIYRDLVGRGETYEHTN